jgi:uncharacterized protein YoaH (UPF0181 family)
MALLSNPRHEKFSQLVASGISPKEAYTSVGYKPTGAKQAASRLLTNVDVRERVSELQAASARSSAEALILSRERVLNRLSELSHEAQQKGHYGAAARCEELIGKEIGMFAQPDELWDGNLNALTPSQLKMVGEQLIRQVTNGDPHKIAELRRKALEKPTSERTIDVKPSGAAT